MSITFSLVLDKTFCCEQVHQCGKMPANLLEKSMENLQIYLYAKTSLYQRSNIIFLFVFVCVSVFMNYKVSGVGI
jgi:hypothetical protein